MEERGDEALMPMARERRKPALEPGFLPHSMTITRALVTNNGPTPALEHETLLLRSPATLFSPFWFYGLLPEVGVLATLLASLV